HRHPARHLACRVSAHPIGNAEEPLLGVDEVRILVLGAAEPVVGRGCRYESHARKARPARRRWQGAADAERRAGHADCPRAWGMRPGARTGFVAAGLLLVAVTACRRDLAEDHASAPAPPPAAEIAPVRESETL